MKFLTLSVIISLILCVLFTGVVIALECMGIEVSDTLIQYFFTVFGVEFAATAAIKISKHTIEKQKVKDRVEQIKENNLPLEKEDLKTSDNDDYIEEYYG